MRFALDIPNFGDFSDIRLISEVAAGAEEAGWDGVFLWDHIARSTAFAPGLPFADVTVALTAIALSTERVTFGTSVTPLPRRRPHKVAREFVSLDHLSGGRVVLGVGLGSPVDSEYEAFGEKAGARQRADLLDESLHVINSLWEGRPVDYDGDLLHVHTDAFVPRPIQQPRIPIWVGARWPGKPRPMRRAAAWDGFIPTRAPSSDGKEGFDPDEVAQIREQIGPGPDLVIMPPTGAEPEAYEQAGASWWMEVATDRDTALRKVTEGPPR
jgi:alkanesulfonate monooxygenase SsuD/methylene tetrahydromethanopterin reductase-like flavin-dependent oxidoreductase (luciferase family)